MKKQRWTIAALFVALALVAGAAQRYSLVRVSNDSGSDLARVGVLAEAFQLEVGALRAGESRWFLRRASGNCALRLDVTSPDKTMSDGAGFLLSDGHGHFVTISIGPEARVRLGSFPEAYFNTTTTLAVK